MSFQANAESRKGKKKDQKIWMNIKLNAQMKQEPQRKERQIHEKASNSGSGVSSLQF